MHLDQRLDLFQLHEVKRIDTHVHQVIGSFCFHFFGRLETPLLLVWLVWIVQAFLHQSRFLCFGDKTDILLHSERKLFVASLSRVWIQRRDLGPKFAFVSEKLLDVFGFLS